MSSVRFNGKPIKETYPDADLWATETGCGLALTNIACQNGDVISIDKDATFHNDKFQMTMASHFIFTYDGSSYALSTSNSGAYLEKLLSAYTIVKMRVYEDGNSNSNQLAFKVMNDETESESVVDLGYSKSSWTKLDVDMAFMSSVRFNGKPIKEVFSDVELWATETGSGLALKNITCQNGDVISIDKNAVFMDNGVTMTMKRHFVFTYNGSSFDMTTFNNSAYLEQFANNYTIVRIGLYGDGNTTSQQIAFKFMNDETESDSVVNLGYSTSGWTKLNTDMAFMSNILFNGTPIKEVFSDVGLWATETGCGLVLENFKCKNGDIIAIESGAEFTNGDVTMTMAKRFAFRYNATSGAYAIGNAFVEEISNRNYYIVDTETYKSVSSNTQLAFKLLDNLDSEYSLVYLGYTKNNWTKLDSNAPFISSIKINGTPIKQVYQDLEFWAMETGDGLALSGLNLSQGDVITIDKDAVFENGDIKARIMHELSFTYVGGEDKPFEVADNSDKVINEYGIVAVRVYGDGNTTKNQLALKFLNNETESASTVELGYSKTNWTKLNTETAFMSNVLFNGRPIKEVFPSVELWALNTSSGLALKNVTCQDGDVISIALGTEFINGEIKMTMQYTFVFTYTEETFDTVRSNEMAQPPVNPPADSDDDSNVDSDVSNNTSDSDSVSVSDNDTSGEITTKGCRSVVNVFGILVILAMATVIMKKRKA